MDLITLAKYPFLKESRKYLKENGPNLEDLINDIAFSTTRELGYSRVLHSLEKTEEYNFSSTPECINEILSYIIARILVSCSSDPYIIKWYSLDEATRINYRLENENMDFIISVAQELGVETTKDNENAKIHFVDYLKFATSFRSKKWKLINQDMQKGNITLKRKEFARLLREVLRIRFESELPLIINDDIKKAFSKDVTQLKNKAEIRKKRYENKDLGKVSALKFPPCIRHLHGMLGSGINVPHQGRFALTAFLHNIGMNINQILKMYHLSPDFDESKAMYQIRHITGDISGTKYKALACKAMKTYGICFNPDELCKFISHPIGYYGIKKRKYSPGNIFSNEIKITINNFEKENKKIPENSMNLFGVVRKIDWKKSLNVDNFKQVENVKEPKAVKIKVMVNKSFLAGTKIRFGEDEKYFVYLIPIFEDKFGNKIQSLAIIDWYLIGKLIGKNKKHITIVGLLLEIGSKTFFYVRDVVN